MLSLNVLRRGWLAGLPLRDCVQEEVQEGYWAGRCFPREGPREEEDC